MIDLELIEKLASIIPINKEDIKRLLLIEDNKTIDIYENYYKFIIDQQLETTLISRILRFVKEYHIANVNYNIFTWCIICKTGYIKYIKNCFKYFIDYYSQRFDLTLITRIRLSLLKTKQHVKKEIYYVDLFNYSLNPNLHNKKIKRLFDTKKIDRIYIYKLNNEETLS